MKLKNLEFDHSAKTIHQAVSIPEQVRNRCKERIFFCSFANFLQKAELFEDPDDAPVSMTTCSGDLSRTLDMINDQLEYEYTLLSFINTHQLSKMALGYYQFMSDVSNSKENRLKAKLMAMAAEMKLAEEAKAEQMESELQYTPSNLVKRISLVKKSHYNFDTYCNMLNSIITTEYFDEPGEKPDFDIDDLLKSILE